MGWKLIKRSHPDQPDDRASRCWGGYRDPAERIAHKSRLLV